MKHTAAVAMFLAVASVAAAELRLPAHISDHMVVQQQEPFVVHGWADPGTSIDVTFGGERGSGTAGSDGTWSVSVDPGKATAIPRDLLIRAGAEMYAVRDVLVGEVWLCSGQSNMVWTARSSDRFEEVRAGADRPMIRMFTVARVPAEEPADDLRGEWVVSSPETVGDFSAVAYHFGKALVDRLDVPVGLVNSSWGGSKSEAWTCREALTRVSAGAAALRQMREVRGAQAEGAARAAVEFDDADWIEGRVPGKFSENGIPQQVDGIVWYRIPFDVPAAWSGRTLTVSLGPVDDDDVTYFGGERIGATNGWQRPRVYEVAGDRVTAGPTVIAVRVVDNSGPGGLHGAEDLLFVHPSDDPQDRRSLAGAARLEVASAIAPPPTQHQPCVLYNGMIHPLLDVAFAGVIWYQGESNGIGAGVADTYGELFPALIHDWRWRFDDADLPFYTVQLANLGYRQTDWDFPLVRDVQRRSLELPNTGLAVTIDIGDANDIHPRNKHDVGDRLARWALTDHYGIQGIVKSGPLVAGAQAVPGSRINVRFETFGSPLMAVGGELRGFEVAQYGKPFIATRARIAGGGVVEVDIPREVAGEGIQYLVRYAWAPDPMAASSLGANLFNAAGLPASPFEVITD